MYGPYKDIGHYLLVILMEIQGDKVLPILFYKFVEKISIIKFNNLISILKIFG